MATPTPQPDDLRYIRDLLKEINRRLETLERPTGTQTAGLLSQVQTQLATVDSRVATAVAANSYTRAQTDAKVASPGNIAPGNVTASGNVTATGSGVFPGGVNSTDVYNRLLTYGGGYKTQYVHADGSMGYVPSSRRFKQDIAPAELDPRVALAIRLVTFHYVAAAQNPDYPLVLEWGVIAEDIHDLGLTWLVDYDEEGLPVGVKYDRLVLAFIPTMQNLDERLSKLESLTD